MSTTGKIKLNGYEDLFGGSNADSNPAVEIKISDIVPFAKHPFHIKHDEQMDTLITSIKERGVLTPVLVRPAKNGKYEMVSGHRRMYAAKEAGLTLLPAIIKEMSDDDATIFMVDSNIQREELLPSERAFALKMKLDAIRHQGASRPEVDKLSCDKVGESGGICGRQVLRYIRLTQLLPELLEMVDNKELQLNLGSDIAGLRSETQKYILRFIQSGNKITAEQIASIKELDQLGKVDSADAARILKPPTAKTKKFSMKEKQFRAYFPKSYSSSDIEKVVISLLENWKKENSR